jgi:ribosomal protein L31
MGSPGSYYSMLTSTDTTAGLEIKAFANLLNVQCENCHGPNQSDAHQLTTDGLARRNLKADVCGQCHGEPLRHGRYQQWQESLHANTTLAMQRGAADGSTALPTAPASDTANCNTKCQQTWANANNNGNHCARCHSGEGYVIWQDQSSSDMNFSRKLQGASGDATLSEVVSMGLTKANVHSQTCGTCHDPHDVGMTSGDPNTTNVRVMGDIAMLPAGFAAIGLGKGALCSTCHNSRNGVHNDTNTYAAPGQVSIGTPHDSTATEVLLGQNMYFATPGQRGGHSFITDTCVNCHMRLTPPPEEYSYQGTGTNHSFKADLSICSTCHGAFDGSTVQTTTKASLATLLNFIGNGIKQKFAALGSNAATKTIWVLARRNMTDSTAAYSHAAAANTAAPNQISNAYTDITPYNIGIDLSANPVKAITMIEDSTTFQVTLTNPISIAWVDSKGNALTTLGTNGTESVSSFYVSLTTMRADNGSGTGPSTALDGTECPISLTGNVMKSLWNYISLYREGSWGIHNPGYTNTVIGATMSQDLTK